jgi:hypothetical protein
VKNKIIIGLGLVVIFVVGLLVARVFIDKGTNVADLGVESESGLEVGSESGSEVDSESGSGVDSGVEVAVTTTETVVVEEPAPTQSRFQDGLPSEIAGNLAAYYEPDTNTFVEKYNEELARRLNEQIYEGIAAAGETLPSGVSVSVLYELGEEAASFSQRLWTDLETKKIFYVRNCLYAGNAYYAPPKKGWRDNEFLRIDENDPAFGYMYYDRFLGNVSELSGKLVQVYKPPFLRNSSFGDTVFEFNNFVNGVMLAAIYWECYGEDMVPNEVIRSYFDGRRVEEVINYASGGAYDYADPVGMSNGTGGMTFESIKVTPAGETSVGNSVYAVYFSRGSGYGYTRYLEELPNHKFTALRDFKVPSGSSVGVAEY